MKKIITLLLFGILLFPFSVTGQSEPCIDDLLDVLNVSTFKSISEVFTAEEIQMLRSHFAANENSSPVTENGDDTYAYGPEDQSGNYGRFDISDPSVFDMITTSSAPAFEGAGASSDDGTLAYAIDSDNNFYFVDILTGSYTFQGKVTPPNGETFTGLETDPTDDNKLYAISSDGMQSSLSTINPVTLIVTLIGITTMVLAISLAITLTGQLFALDIDNDALYSINKVTALALFIGFIGFDANFGQAMARVAATGIIMMAAFNNDVFDSELRTVNLITGLTTLIGVIVVATITQFGWIAIPNLLTGITDKELSSFRFYPNPAGNSLHFEARDRIESVSIYNVQGQRIMYQPIDALSSQLDISYLASGQYICRAVVDGREGSYQIIKQ